MKKRWIIIGASVLLVGGCLAAVGAASSESTNAGSVSVVPSDDESSTVQNEDKVSTNASTYGDQDHPVKIHQGEAFDVRGFHYRAGWQLHSDFGDVTIKGLKVTNHRPDSDSALVQIQLWRHSEVLATIDCDSDTIVTGSTVRLDCSSTDEMPQRFTKITIRDEF